MAKFEFPTDDWAYEIAKDFEIAEYALPRIVAQAVYQGAKVIADAGHAAAAKYGLSAGFGVASHKKTADGSQTSAGFRDGGYFTNRWGESVPYDLVANVLEYGSSKVKATHFMSRAFKAARPKAQEVMRQVVHQKMTELLERK